MSIFSRIGQGLRNVQNHVQKTVEPPRNQSNARAVRAPARASVQQVATPQRARQSTNAINHLAGNLAHQATKFFGRGRTSRGEQAAYSAVRVDSQDTVDKRDEYRAQSRAIANEARTKAQELFQRQNSQTLQTPFPLQPQQQAEHLTHDAQGNVTRIERATRNGEHYTYENITFENGAAQRQSYSTDGSRSTSRVETWKQPPSKRPAKPSSDELMVMAQNGRAEIHELSVERSGAKTIVHELDADIKGRSSMTQTFSRQTHLEGIHDDLDSKFEKGSPVEVLEIKGTRQGWCEKEQIVETKAYAQGDRIATSSIVRDAEGNKSKLWSLEIQRGDLYEKQDFIEGNNDFRSVTTRRANGSVVTENVRTQFKKDGDWVRPSSDQVTTFNDDGTVRKMERRSTDENHVITKQVYERTQQVTARGLEVKEKTQTVQTGWEDEENLVQRQSIQETKSLLGPNGFQLLGARQTLIGPEGTAQATTNANGRQLTFDGRAISSQQQFEQLPAASRDFVRTAQEGLDAQLNFYAGPSAPDARRDANLPPGEAPRAGADVNRVKGFVGATKQTFDLLRPVTTGLDNSVAPKISFGNNRLIAHEFTSNNLGGLSSMLGLAGAGLNLHQSLQQGNYLQAAVDGASFASAGVTVPKTVAEFVKGARGGVPLGYARAGAGVADEGLEIAAGGARFADTAGRGVKALRFGTKIAGPAAAVLGFGVSTYDFVKAWQGGDTSQTAAAGVMAVGSGVGLGIAVASAAGVGSLGGPLGTAIGAGVGLAAFGISQGINWIADDEHDIPDVVIGK
ncbi:MAG TPA: hypothetical protein VGB73_09985 [Pyrinomonadaceae bacterium]|jgi:hypothetical protein